MHRSSLIGLAVLWLAAAPFATGSVTEEPPAPRFKIYLEEPGAYRVDFEDLASAGLDGPQPSSGIGLEVAGQPAALWVEDGGDGSFGPGDWIEFVGERLRGEYSFHSEHTRFNVYFLSFDHPSPRRMRAVAAETVSETSCGEGPASDGQPSGLRTWRHLEEDLLILRLRPTRNGEPEELWYWSKLAHNKDPFSVRLDLRDLDVRAGGTVDLRLGFRGWSRPAGKASPDVADHRVDVVLGGVAIGNSEWNGTTPHTLEIPGLAAEDLTRDEYILELSIPKRQEGRDGATLIDVVMLNWIEISYPRTRWIGDRQASFEVTSAESQVELCRDSGRELLVYGDEGSRFLATGSVAARLTTTEKRFQALEPAQFFEPDAMVRDQPSRLAAVDQQADYLMVAHRKLLEAAKPLADFHRQRGLRVALIDVEDVYDEFSHGVVHPQALRDFFAHAHQNWQEPKPRFALLVGDASWDGKNQEAADHNYADWTYRPRETSLFAKNASTPYPDAADLNHRGLIPTWNHSTYEGHAASDNYFVAFGEDSLPDMAIGRLPVVEPEEVAQIVAKTIRYASRPEVGPWRRSALLITNESVGFQRRSDRLATDLIADGFVAHKIYPAKAEKSNELHTQKLIDTFDEGQLLVHFLGHGGRYIWRTGPPDFEKNHDLFTLDHLDELEPSERLPIVLSLTCYSAPFDHPSADSIGEKLLRLPDRGAVGVLAASWRNSPSPKWGEVLFTELTQPGATLGEAIQRSKEQIRNRLFVQTYNLLGDPAVPVALPSGEIEMTTSQTHEESIRLSGNVSLEGFSGKIMVDIFDDLGEIVRTATLDTSAPSFELDMRSDEMAEAFAVRAYAWNAAAGIDASGSLILREVEEPQRQKPARRGSR